MRKKRVSVALLSAAATAEGKPTHKIHKYPSIYFSEIQVKIEYFCRNNPAWGESSIVMLR